MYDTAPPEPICLPIYGLQEPFTTIPHRRTQLFHPLCNLFDRPGASGPFVYGDLRRVGWGGGILLQIMMLVIKFRHDHESIDQE